MDHAVSLVQAYLHLNGYFTVAEYPVLSRLPGGGFVSATDVDLLGLRLGGAGGGAAAGDESPTEFEPDPALNIPAGAADVLIVEVKEGRAELNAGARDRETLSAVLRRFGLGDFEKHDRAVAELSKRGETRWAGDVSVRLFAFGSVVDPNVVRGFRALSLPHVTQYLTSYIETNWEALRHAHIKHEAMGFLALIEQVRRVRPAE